MSEIKEISSKISELRTHHLEDIEDVEDVTRVAQNTGLRKNARGRSGSFKFRGGHRKWPAETAENGND